MVNTTHRVFKADDRSYFAILKKDIHALAVSAGFSEHKVGEIDIIVAEMTSNLVKHAGGGQIWVKLVEDHDLQGIELISIDNGKGMADVARMTADGISTKNTLGQGLGAMKRLAHVFQVYSQKNWGTIVLARVFAEDPPLYKKAARTEIKAVVLPKPGEEECGDGFSSITTADHIKLFLGDGLGHGADAAYAVQKAIAAFNECRDDDPVDIIRYINEQVKKTRGLVGTIAVFDVQQKTWRICGVGNIATKFFGPTMTKGYMAYNGIIGLNVPRNLNAQELPYENGQHLIMCSDGIKSRWDTLKYTGILRYDLSILAASIVKDFARNTDDMSVLTCKIKV